MLSVKSGRYGEPISAVSTVRLPPSSRPRARPGVIARVRFSSGTIAPVSSRGFSKTASSPRHTTRCNQSTLVGFQSLAPLGPWKVIAPVRACSDSRSAVMSL